MPIIKRLAPQINTIHAFNDRRQNKELLMFIMRRYIADGKMKQIRAPAVTPTTSNTDAIFGIYNAQINDIATVVAVRHLVHLVMSATMLWARICSYIIFIGNKFIGKETLRATAIAKYAITTEIRPLSSSGERLPKTEGCVFAPIATILIPQ